MKPLRLAVDTNVLLDFADGVEVVVDSLDVLDRRLPEKDVVVLPSVLDELAFLCDSGDTELVRQSAFSAIGLLQQDDRFRPLLQLATPPELATQLAREVRFQGLVPEKEVHDSLILLKPPFSAAQCC